MAKAAERLQTRGTFSRGTEGGIRFSDADGGQIYYVIDSLKDQASPHLGKPVRVIARVKPTKTGQGMLMVHLVSVQSDP